MCVSVCPDTKCRLVTIELHLVRLPRLRISGVMPGGIAPVWLDTAGFVTHLVMVPIEMVRTVYNVGSLGINIFRDVPGGIAPVWLDTAGFVPHSAMMPIDMASTVYS